MAIKWNFPSNQFGTITGIGEAGIETFKGTPYRSLAREICQNSLDARISDEKPVIIDFSLSMERKDSIPGFKDLSDAIKSCLDFWTRQDNKKTIDFFKKADKIANMDLIPVLRISDHYTTGLEGSDKDYNTPWQNLVKASGVSSKSGTSGGSFGIGKSAPFACSDLRTVFYATIDQTRLEATQGIARLVSFEKKEGFLRGKDVITTGTGYYGDDVKNTAIRKCQSLDSQYNRVNTGTDVFIVGFSNKSNWETDIIASVLNDFLISVYDGKLIVNVGDIEISKESLADIIEKYKEYAEDAYNYYQVLTSKESNVMVCDFENLGNIEVHILIKNGLHRRVLMGRSNGMKVFDQKSFPSSIEFAGICILKDDGINSYFREMENPQHDNWEPERHSKPAKAKEMKKKLYQFLKEQVLKYGRQTTAEEVDVEGMGNYIPDEPEEESGNNNKEQITDTIKSVDISMNKRNETKNGYEKRSSKNSGNADEFALGQAELEAAGGTGGKDGFDFSSNTEKGSGSFGGGEGDGPGTRGNGENPFQLGLDIEGNEPIRKKIEINTMSVRLFKISSSQNRYRLIFIPEKSSGDGYLQIKLSGEQSNVDNIRISNAVNVISSKSLETNKNNIYLNNIITKTKMSVEFDIDYKESSSLEVSLFGYQI